MADLSSLVIRLSADVAQLQSDLGRANAIAQRNADQMRKMYEGALGSVRGSIQQFAVGFASAFSVGAAVALSKSVIDLGDNLNKVSQKVGVSVESLSALRNAASLSDVSFQDLGGAMEKLARTAAAAAGGSREQADTFRAMGVAVKDTAGNLRPMQDILVDVATKFSAYEDSAAKTALAQRAFGKSGADLIPLLNQLGTDGFGTVIQAAKDYNQIIGAEQAQQSEAFNDNLTRLTSAASGFASAIVKDMLPGLVRYTSAMAEASKTTDGYASSASIFANAGKSIVLAATAAKDTITALITVVIGLGDTLGAAGDLFNGFATAVGNDMKAVSLVMTGDFAGAKAALADAGTSLADGWSTAVTRVKGAWAGVKGGVLDAVSDTGKAYDDLFGKFSNVSGGATVAAKNVEKMNAPIVASAGAAKQAAKEHVQFAAALKEAAQAMERLQQLASDYQSDIDEIRARMSGADDAQIAYNKALREIQDNYTKILALGPPTAEAIAAMGTATEAAGERMDLTRVYDGQKDAMEKYRAELQKTADMWGNFSDAVFDAVTKSGNFLKNLLDNLKSVVLQMLKEWARTKVIGYFTGQAGGTGGGWGSLVSAGVSAYSGGGGGIGGLIGSYTGGSSGTGLIGTAGNAYQTGATMWDGFEAGFSASGTASSNMFGTYTPDYGTGTYTPSALGYTTAIAGGVYAGYNRYQQSDGGFAGAAGGAAYGVGTAYAAIGTSAALSGGLAAGFAAIPVVGWIAIALMLVDMASGGKLFGTKGKMEGGSTALNVDAAGANYTNGISLKGQQALFGGAKWSWEEVAQTEDQKKAAQEFFDGMTKTMADYAKHYGVEAGGLVSASFEQKFDKKGNLTGETTSIIGGHTYDKLDSAGFSQAYVSANQLEVLSQFDDKLKGTIDQYLDSVDELNSIAAGLSQAQDMLANGGQFLAISGEQTLSAIVAFAEGVRQGGELIGDAIQRLIQAQAQYDQFVSQFKPPTQFVNEFEASLSGINQQMLSNIKQANALAVAAGAAGASEKDLANIHEYAAHQAAQALLALEQSAQSLAFGLGITTIGSLDQVNSEIQRLQGKANSGTGAVQGFGNAMQSAAQQASDAMNLLLGDLSPLNDQTKLQKALEGLRAGTVSQEQVLQIGRRLYASSQAYNDLFAMVQSMGRPSASARQGGGSGLGSGAGGGLTGAERERLSALLKEQQQLQAAAQLAQYQSLAKQIAEIASAKGEDWRTVVEQMGINIADFEAGLQMNDAQTADYIATQQSLLDDNNENTISIIKALNDGFDAVVTTLGGTPATHSTHEDSDGASDDSGHSGRGLGHVIVRGFTDALNRNSDRAQSMHPRSTRVPARA